MNTYKSRKQTRLKGYDYSLEGHYFVTICSKDRKNIFGEIEVVGAGLASARYKNEIRLSKLGQLIDSQWQNIKKQYYNVELDQYIIMPNHIHGIIIVDNSVSLRADARPAPTVSDIVCSFKSKCSVEYVKYIQQNNLNIPGKIWQRSFNDHIIRTANSLENIREYIMNNPVKWDEDENNNQKGQACLTPTSNK
ncbi:MAG: transposase [Elusimicrobia bacterium]|nr:transposase [Candidatus Liberimonas magnetica]